MTEALLPLPDSCSRALDALQADPIEPGAETERHLRTCRACAEARVAFLAQEEAPEILAPAGYHERLPDRILAKLPARAPLHRRLAPLTWAAAAALLMAVSAGAFWAGRANRTPLMEAALPRPAEPVEAATSVSDTPFHDREEDAARVQSLSPDELKALLKQLDPPPPASR